MQQPTQPSPDDLAALEAFLSDAARAETALTYRETHGFLFALACAPELVHLSEWLPFILGEDDPGFADEGEMQRVIGALVGLYNEVNRQVLEGDVSLPDCCAFGEDVLSNLESGAPVSEWSEGLRAGHVWLEESWDAVPHEELDQELGACMMALTFFASRELAEALAGEMQGADTSVERLATTFRDIFEEAMSEYAGIGRGLYEALLESGESGSAAGRPYVAPDRIRRNDPCPCGSGKKFKKCCGRSVH